MRLYKQENTSRKTFIKRTTAALGGFCLFSWSSKSSAIVVKPAKKAVARESILS